MARPMPQRMQSSRRNIGGGGGGNNRYADEEYSTSQYSDGGEYYDDDYYEDEYDDDGGGGYDDYDDDYDNNNDLRNFRRSSGGAARNNYGGGGGGGRHRNKAASFHDNRDYNRRRSFDNYDYDDNRGGGRHNRRGSDGGGRGGGRQQHHRRSNSANNAPSSSLHMLPGTPKQAQDIIRKYTLGMPLQSLNHMALPPTSPPPGPAREIATLTVANLLPQEYAFVRRSNGQWTFAQVAVKHEQLGQLVFIVNKQGSTKSFKRMEWSGFVRRIKGTERKVTLPPQITASGEQQHQQQQVSSGNQDNKDQRASPHLAIENGPSTHNNNNNNRSANPSPTPGNGNSNKLPDISQMSIKEMKLELTSHNINYESFMDKQEFRNAIIDARAEAVKNALIKEQQQMQEKNLQQQQERLQSNYDGFGNYKDPYDDVPGNNNGNNNNGNNNGGDEAVPISTLDADLSNLAGQTITLQPMNDDEVSELMGDYLLTEYKFQMKVLEKERQKKQQGNKLGSINEGGGGGSSGKGGGGGGLRNSQMSGSFNIEAEDGGGGQLQQTHYEKQAFAKSQKWGSLGDSNV